MRVFSVEMLVKEEGAAVVQAALGRLKKETQAVAAEMKTTSQAVTGTGAAMQTAAQGTQIAGDRAAKAAIGFAAVGQSMARTGTLTADAGTRIVEAGSQIATMFGPGGLAVAALLAFAASAVTSFTRAKNEAIKMKEETQKALREMVLSGDVANIDKQLRDVQQGMLDIPSGQFVGGLDDLRLKYNQLNAALQNFVITERGQVVGGQNSVYVASKQEIAYNALSVQVTKLREEIKKLEADEASLLRARQLAVKFGDKTPVAGALRPLPAQQATGITTIEQRADTSFIFDRGKLKTAVQAAIPKAGEIVLSEANRMAAELAINLQQTFQDNIGNALVGGIVGGIEQAVASGNISQGFKAMTSMMLAGIGDAMIKFGTATAAFSKFMKGIKDKLATLQPEASLAMSIALIGAGAVLKGAARGMFGGQSGGAAFSTASFGGASFGGGAGAMTLPTTQLVFGNTSATTAAGMQPRQPMNVTVIGPNDPTAQRTIQELMVKANSRGRIG